LISVIVVNWNRRDLLEACLRSLQSQQGVDLRNLEVIVVDNGSADGSVQMVERFSRASGGLVTRLIRNDENRGFCAANNQGIRAVNPECEWIAVLNNDAEADPYWVAALHRAIAPRPDVGMAASKILVFENPGRIDKAGHLIFLDGQNRGRGSGEIDRGQYDRLEETAWPDGCAAMYRKSMLDAIGGFDEDFFAYADDAELGLRARIAGWNCLYVPDAVVRHHRGASLGLQSARRLELIERNRVLLAVKLFPWSLLWLNGAFYLVRIAAGVWAAILGKGEAVLYPGLGGKLRIAMALLKGDLAALPLLPRMLRKRKEIQTIRKLSNQEILSLLLRFRISLRELSRQSTIQ
jgi:GT2 family glycosyltransferase